MVKPLSFKGDAPLKKKRKHRATDTDTPGQDPSSASPALDDDDSWVAADAASDLAGPVVLILPPSESGPTSTDKSLGAQVTCVACDANGEVFASALENLTEGADAGTTAEPHDVRQVWVASRVAGTGDGVVCLKGHHGR